MIMKFITYIIIIQKICNFINRLLTCHRICFTKTQMIIIPCVCICFLLNTFKKKS